MFEKLMKVMGAPECARPYLSIIFTEEDCKAVCLIGNQTFSCEDLKPVLGKQAEAYCKDAYHRGVVSYADDERDIFCWAGFYERMDVMAVSQQELYRTIPEEGRKAICEWLFEQYADGLDQNLRVRPTDDQILPLEEVLDYIESRRGQPVYLNFCDCKSLNGECGKPRDVCVTYKDNRNSYADRGLSRKIDADQAKDVIRRADKAGLMHTVNKRGICSCCGDCCYLFRSMEKRNSQKFWPESRYVIHLDKEKCVSCGLCMKRCWFDVFDKVDGKIHADVSRCVGCGICQTACPKDALELLFFEK